MNKPRSKPLKVPISQAEQTRRRRRRFPWWTLPIIVLCLCLLAAAWVFADEQIAQYNQFNTKRATVAGNVFFGPVYIDDTPIGGLTMDEARVALSGHIDAQAASFRLTLSADGRQWQISSEDIPMAWNTEALLQQAYMIGRKGSLEERYRQVTGLTTPINLYSEFSYDREAVRQITDAIARELTIAPVSAEVVAFDVANRSFAFSNETVGQAVDAESLYRTVIYQLDSGQYGSVVSINVAPQQPAVTRAQLEAEYTRIASFTTKTTKDSNRNNNINLAAHALNGKMIAAGGTISFNETTGERTKDKGYLEAGAIENGRTVQETGGGVCQVSSTLFNALARANCAIEDRKPHAWPSDYVPRGEDATVDWPRLDLVMRNTSDAPMFITAWYEDQTVTVEVYGLSLGDGVTIELESETTYQKKPTEVVYTYNASLPIGTEKQVKKPRTGYSVQTYKVWLQDGQVTARDKFYTSEYRMISEEYEYNDGKPPA